MSQSRLSLTLCPGSILLNFHPPVVVKQLSLNMWVMNSEVLLSQSCRKIGATCGTSQQFPRFPAYFSTIWDHGGKCRDKLSSDEDRSSAVHILDYEGHADIGTTQDLDGIMQIRSKSAALSPQERTAYRFSVWITRRSTRTNSTCLTQLKRLRRPLPLKQNWERKSRWIKSLQSKKVDSICQTEWIWFSNQPQLFHSFSIRQ